MRSLRVLAVLGVVLVVSLVAGAYAVGTEPPTMTPAEARLFTAEALATTGARDVEVQDDVREEVFVPKEGEEPIPVYVVPAEIAGNRLELYVQRTGDRAVNLDDAMPDGGYLLGDEQFKKLEEFRLDPARERVAERRRGPATLAGALVLVMGVVLLVSVVRNRTRSTVSDAAA